LLDIRRSTLVVALAVTAALPVAADACDGLVRGPKGIVTSVTDGDTLLLDSGLVIRLIGTQAPKLPLGREGFPTWPKADQAKDALEALTLGKPVQLFYGGARVDRYGRALGQLFVAGEPQVWVQGEMIAEGMARVYSFPDNRACVGELLAMEAGARVNRVGIWTDPYYSVRRADRPADLLRREGRYELVEGRVLLAERSGALVYLNFGRFWKEDFTVTIDAGALRDFGKVDPLALEGALIRVRGWVEVRDGPRLEVTHPEQIEVLSGP
jgi:endonuclease YncB( thermonuclease family)